MDKTRTDRRSFLKTGTVVAAPLAAVVPVGVLAADDSRAKLARIEDERAVEALQRKFVRYLNGAADCDEFVAPSASVDLGEGLRAIAENPAHEAELVLAEDGGSATTRCACKVERETEFTGETTLERMARFEGRGSARFSEDQVLATEFVKGKDGWKIAGAKLA